MGNAYALYAVVSVDGKLRRKAQKQGGGLMIYDSLGIAQRQARRPGDSVVELHLNLDREPLFIREAKKP